MRRLPGILLTISATIVVIVALMVSGLRLALPQLDRFQSQLVGKVQSMTGVPVKLKQISGSWQTFGPTLEVKSLQVTLPESLLQVERITLALDVWQSLLHWRWQFRDLTFYNLQLDLNSTLGGGDNQDNSIQANRLSDLFFKQVDHFDLRDSRISFLTPSGSRAEFDIPQLTWLNSPQRHRAEGQLGLSSFNGQHGVVQLRMDLNDTNGFLNNGKVFLQADNIDMKPWFSRWLRSNTGLKSADFSLSAWLTLRDGEIFAGDMLVKKGEATWQSGNQAHRLDIENLSLQGNRQSHGWQINTSQLNIKTDGLDWPKGALTALYLPENTQFLGPVQEEELRLRGTDLQLERIGPLIPTIAFLTPTILERWADLKPRGTLENFALDIPLKQPERTRFEANWNNLSWNGWKLLPGMDNFSGSLSGSVPNGQLKINLRESLLPYGETFRAPLEISQATAAFNWEIGEQGWRLWAKGIDVRAKGLWANGDFDFYQPTGNEQLPAKGEPWLKILAGIRLYDASQAWRYFPEPLMSKHLVDYLSSAIQGGEVDNATLTFNGNPHQFPFKHNEGQFEVWVPLRNATFQFEPKWPALTALDIDLDFLNDGLFMKAKQTKLGAVDGKNVTANIPDYKQEKLLIDADIQGSGKNIGQYFMQTPLDNSLGSALQELQIGGDVSGRLHLDIPLDGEAVRATGDVRLKDNSLLIKPLESTFEHLSGQFRYDNGNLTSDKLTARWFGQPISVNFSTQEIPSDYKIQAEIAGNWQLSQLPDLPKEIADKISGVTAWKSNVDVSLPHKGTPNYKVVMNADLKNVSSHLPDPLNKKAGQAMPLVVNVQGDLRGFTLNGVLAGSDRFNSRWLLGKQLVLDRATWAVSSSSTPALPENSSLLLNLPALDAESLLALLTSDESPLDTASPGKKTQKASNQAPAFSFPNLVTLTTPKLAFGGQVWNKLQLQSVQTDNGIQITAKGNEIDGTLQMNDKSPWKANLRYLYFNPQWSSVAGNSDEGKTLAPAEPSPFDTQKISFAGWPALELRCESCWFFGQNYGRVQADTTPQGQKLILRNGLIDTGVARLDIEGEWEQSTEGEKTALKGEFSGQKIEDISAFFGVSMPLKGSPFESKFDLHWRNVPWKPDIKTLNGTLNNKVGKGEIADIGGGRTGQLLRFLSFDALLRKLRLDFSDTFGKGFYFDSIKSTAWIKDGVLNTNDLFIDGLAADISINGSVDLVNRRLSLEAIITPEVSATVGVATAFAVNPVIGVAVFAASKVLAPLWNKISLIRYQIGGTIEQPSINEVLRESKGKPAQAAATH